MKELVLKISQIVVDARFVTRTVDSSWVARIGEAICFKRKMPPLKVGLHAGRYYLLGGEHRLRAWKHFYGEKDGHLRCEVVECATIKEMERAAMIDNRDNARPYTDAERLALYYRHQGKDGWTDAELRDTLNLSDERVKRMEERAGAVETPMEQERAVADEPPAVYERAV